ncbi:unnamed protein product [Pylaiella littoralis]
MVARKVEHAETLAAVLKTRIFSTYNADVALLLDILEAGGVSCGLEESSSESNTNDGRRTCSTEHDQCMETCSAARGGLFRGGQSPAAGTCDLVCAVAYHGCQRCVKKKGLRAAKA